MGILLKTLARISGIRKSEGDKSQRMATFCILELYHTTVEPAAYVSKYSNTQRHVCLPPVWKLVVVLVQPYPVKDLNLPFDSCVMVGDVQFILHTMCSSLM